MNHVVTYLAWAGIVVAIGAVALPLAAIVLVSLASIREEAAASLSGEPRGWAERTARRVLGYHADRSAMSGTGTRADTGQARIRFAHARRLVPDPRREPALGELGASAGGASHRSRAGV